MTPGTARRALAVAATALAVAAAGPGIPGAAAATAKTIHPGVSVNFGGVTCTAGAVMRERRTVYLAVPASCGGIDSGKEQDGCDEAEAPLGSPVSIQGARHNGTLVYSSFTEMQLRGVRASGWCYYNDLALIRVDRRDVGRVTGAISGTDAPQQIRSTLPNSGTALRIGANAATAGQTFHRGWELDATSMAMFKATDAGAAVTAGNQLVGMLIVLPKGAVPAQPLQSPAEVYNLSRAMTFLHHTPGFRRVSLVRAGERP